MTPARRSGAETSGYKPYTNAGRPGGRPGARPRYRVLVHRRHEERWNQLIERIGVEQAQRFYDHVAQTPGTPADGIKVNVLKGRAGRPQATGFSPTIHWRVPGSPVRLDYQYNDRYRGGRRGDPHAVVWVIAISFTSH